MPCQLLARLPFPQAIRNRKLGVLRWLTLELSDTKTLRMLAAAMAVSLIGAMPSGGSLLGQEKSGVSIALTLTPAAPEVANKSEPLKEDRAAAKPVGGKTEKLAEEHGVRGATAVATPGENPFALSMFAHPKVDADAKPSTTVNVVDIQSTDSKHAEGQLKLVDSGAGQSTLSSRQTKSAPAKSDQPETADSKRGALSSGSNGVTGAAKRSQETPPSPSQVPTTAKSPKLAEKVAPTEVSKSSPKKVASSLEPSGSKTSPSGNHIKRKRIEFDNEDASSDANASDVATTSPEDVALEQEDHPFDAPAADSSSSQPDRPAAPAPGQFTPQQLRLRAEINRVLGYYMDHPETTARRSPWAVMHTILPFGVETELGAGPRRVNAIGWMCYNGLCKTQRIFQPTQSGFRTNLGPGVQGHEGQFLAVLAQSKVAPNYPIKIGNRTYSINDLVRLEMATCREKSELTFKLIGLSYYIDHNQRWRDNQGGTWSLEKLVAEELSQPVVGAACGGTHRLMGLTFSLLQHKRAGLPVAGHWYRAEEYLNDFVAYALSLQNSDGSFSTEWFESRANEPNVERKVQTTGHTLEWLVYTLPDAQLQSPEIIKSIEFLLNTLGGEPGRDWPIGPRGHALRALALYDQRVFGAEPGKMRQFIANSKNESYLR